MTELTCVGVRRSGREVDGHKAHAWQQTRVQGAREDSAIDPGRTEQLEWRVGAAADGDVARLDEADAGVELGSTLAAQVGRGIGPGEIGGVEPVAALPALHLHHGERGVQVTLTIKV